ncbi:hypothetical protein PPL_03464 [Heterostelium album PN500]|uniref:Uncharacterized protein n=1 Tax=Heterostelium pallidum (strain ATCC 26659 / Pp 5 / PN500) TaxID=670386 RepID=D3B4Y8_HETP5|nr:hypothetical protein PPL_03464 [Heterostelium album PN500]EFA84386.1 hypothetical protein PPL_03464 [Heterostelium album PN500]|eukprot:XP_020436500.1 hypothetical protein PPL_03464 [Heterostelium album PN500]
MDDLGEEERFIHVMIVESNINGCMVLFQCLKSTLGPFGSDKLIVDDDGSYLTSNDGATILRYLEIDHPAARLLISCAKSQDDTVGDGTTSVVLLTCLLLKNALSYLKQSIHPQSIQIGYNIGLDVALSLIDEIEIGFDVEKINSYQHHHQQQRILYDVASTSISSKILARHKDHFARLGVESILKLGGNRNQERIKIISITGGSMLDSHLIDGVMLKYDSQRNRQRNYNFHSKTGNNTFNIIVGKLQLQSVQSDLHFVKLKANLQESNTTLHSKKIQEQDQLLYRNKIDILLNLNVHVVISDTDIPQYLENLFLENNIEYFCIDDSRELERISFVLGTKFVNDISTSLNMEMISKATNIERVSIGDSIFLKISGIKNCDAATVVLRSPTDTMSEECIRSFKDMLNILSSFIHNPYYIGGGGCAYLYIANKIRAKSKATDNVKLQFALNAFADSLESIPLILIQNAGFDGIALLSKLKSIHEQTNDENNNNNLWKGVNLETGEIVDMLNDINVKEPSFLLRNILKLATRAAQMILRINNNILIEPKVAFKPPTS